MLRVKTYLDKSTIPNGGIGLFADEDIEEGTVVWEFVEGMDVEIPEEKLEHMHPLDKEFMLTYPYYNEPTKSFIFPVDNARFFNSSDTPNVKEDKGKAPTLAARKIFKGEELLTNYFLFDGKAKDKLPKNI